MTKNASATLSTVLLGEIRALIEEARTQVARVVNGGLPAGRTRGHPATSTDN